MKIIKVEPPLTIRNMKENPKFNIGEKAYTVLISTNRDRAMIEEYIVTSIILNDGKLLYTINGEKGEYSEEYLYKFEEALEVMRTRKRPSITSNHKE